MKTNTKIKDIHTLKMAKAELTAEVAHREVNMKIKVQELKDSFFDFSKFKQKSTESILGFFESNFNLGASAISNFVIKYLIRPKNKWVRRISMAASNLFIKKYSKVLKAAFNVLLGEANKAIK
jgi:hypothetical protein